MRATRDTLSFRAVWFAARPAPHALSWRRDRALRGGARQSRESLTQDSRSAVKARLVDPLRESFGDRRCTRRGRRRDGLAPRPSRGFRTFVTRRNALERRADRGMRAYVTGSDDARGQESCVRAYGLTPRRVGELKARDARPARRPLRTHRTVAALSGRAQGDGGRRLRSLQALPPKVPTLRAAG